MIYEKVFTATQGQHYDLDHYNTIINEHEACGYNEKGDLLFVMLKGVLKHDNVQLAKDCFLEMSKKQNKNRGFAGGSVDGVVRKYIGNQSYSVSSQKSNIAGFYDRVLRQHTKHFQGKVVCRQTAFTLNNGDLWEKSFPFLQQVSCLYKQYGGVYYERQKKEYDCILDNLKVPDTVFTTITTNLNFRTACHVDKGDFRDGLGVLCFVGDFKGGYVGFPEYKVCLKCEEGDVLLCNVHEYHCNTELSFDSDVDYRLSFVFYIRHDMKQCYEQALWNESKYEYYTPQKKLI